MTDVASAVRQLLGRTEYLAAFDLADRTLADQPDDPVLQHLALLALARAGATDNAADRLRRSGLLDRAATLPVALAEDVLALEARIAKDRALAGPSGHRAALARIAAQLYQDVFERFRRTYTGVNAATMWCVAGELERSRDVANEVLDLLDGSSRADERDYWAAATRAEALLLLRDLDGATAALRAANECDGDIASRASTRRQLALVVDLLGLDPTALDALSVPVVVHYCGHLPAAGLDGIGRLRGDDEQRAAREILAVIARRGSVIGHGSLAAGADILVAEAILASGGEIHVVLPFSAAEFCETSVAVGGEQWVTRFEACLDAASSVSIVTGGRQDDDAAAYAYCSSIAMGGALVRARFMASQAEQLAVWDGQDADGPAGTAADVRRWRATGLPTTVVRVPPLPKSVVAGHSRGRSRTVRALLFADVKGFSGLRDQHIPKFVSSVLGPLAAVLDRAGVDYRNGWGDALYVVITDLGVAADVALLLQESMEAMDLAALGLPNGLGLRIGAHAGPVFELRDPVRDEPSYFGEHVTRAARIEPIAPPGAVYVTEAFASLLAIDRPDGFVCEYVGQVPSAKAFGTMPMYLLRRRWSTEFFEWRRGESNP